MALKEQEVLGGGEGLEGQGHGHEEVLLEIQGGEAPLTDGIVVMVLIHLTTSTVVVLMVVAHLVMVVVMALMTTILEVAVFSIATSPMTVVSMDSVVPPTTATLATVSWTSFVILFMPLFTPSPFSLNHFSLPYFSSPFCSPSISFPPLPPSSQTPQRQG